jgi:SAM-dependent methyltransferase
LQGKLDRQPLIGLIQGDVTRLEFEPEAFDVAVSTQLLEHIPSEEQRRCFLQTAYDCLKPGGYFLLTAYYQDMRRRIKGQPREGFHESGIFFHYFTKKELRREFSRLFEVVHLHPFLFHVPVVWRLEFTRPWVGTICERTPFLKEFGSLILIKAVKQG